MEKKVKALYEISLDKTDPSQKLEKGDVFAVEELVENWIILRKKDGTSCMVDVIDFERGFEATDELPGVIFFDG